MANPWKHPKTGVYYLRMRVPKDVQEFVGATLIKRSLHTKDTAEAKRLHSESATTLLQQWNTLRKGVQSITDRQAAAMAGELYKSALEVGPYRNFILGMHTAGRLMQIEIALGEMDEFPRPELFPRVGTREEALDRILGPLLTDYLHGKGLLLDRLSRDRLLVAVGYAIRQAAYQTLRECEGNWRADPEAERFPVLELPTLKDEKANPSDFSLDDAWAKLSPDYAAATCRRWRPILDGLMASAKKSNLHAITPSDIEEWSAAVLASGEVTRRSFARNNLAAVKTFFGTLKKRKHLTTNPAADAYISVPKRQRGREMRGFWNEEAFKILQASLAQPPKKLSRNFVVARRWVPWLCAYTGARVNEITQARACDVKSIEGYWCIYITPEAGTQKTCSARLVPLHAHLIEQGFLEFARTKKGQEPLFASLVQRAKTAPSELVGAHLAKWVRKMGISDPSVAPNHGWRHRFKTESRGRIAQPFADAIQGHAPATEGGAYGAYPPRVLGPEIAKLPKILLPSEQMKAA